MSRSISEVADGSARTATSISDVSTASATSMQGVEQTRTASTEVARTADDLRRLMDTFTYRFRLAGCHDAWRMGRHV